MSSPCAPIIATYSEAHRRLNRILNFFLVYCIAGTLIGVIDNRWWFATVSLAAGFVTGAIEASAKSAVLASAPEKNDFTDELASERAVESKFLKITSLLATAVLASGFALGIYGGAICSPQVCEHVRHTAAMRAPEKWRG
jgi:MFS family permease